jgi:hypothetical protein
MQLELLARLGRGPILAQRSQCHLGLEGRTVGTGLRRPDDFLFIAKLLLAGLSGPDSLPGVCYISPVQICGAASVSVGVNSRAVESLQFELSVTLKNDAFHVCLLLVGLFQDEWIGRDAFGERQPGAFGLEKFPD